MTDGEALVALDTLAAAAAALRARGLPNTARALEVDVAAPIRVDLADGERERAELAELRAYRDDHEPTDWLERAEAAKRVGDST